MKPAADVCLSKMTASVSNDRRRTAFSDAQSHSFFDCTRLPTSAESRNYMTVRRIFSSALANTWLSSMDTTVGDSWDTMREKEVTIYLRNLLPTHAWTNETCILPRVALFVSNKIVKKYVQTSLNLVPASSSERIRSWIKWRLRWQNLFWLCSNRNNYIALVYILSLTNNTGFTLLCTSFLSSWMSVYLSTFLDLGKMRSHWSLCFLRAWEYSLPKLRISKNSNF